MKNLKFFGFAAGLLGMGLLASCTAESGYINVPGENDQPIVKLVKEPEVNAYVGSRLISKAGISRSYVDNAGNYVYDFPQGEMEKAENITIPSDALDFTKNSFQNDYKGGRYIVYFPEGEYNYPSLGNNNNVTLYVSAGAIVNNPGSNLKDVEVYICEGGTVNFDYNPTTGSWNIYNAGKLTIDNGVGANIYNIYNTNDLIIGNINKFGTELKAGHAIYNKGGYVEFNANNEYYNEWSYSHTDIMGTIISDNIVKFNGKVKFQNNGPRDICHCIATDLIDMTDGDNTFGWIEGPNAKFDGCKIKLHPEGLVDIENKINIPNSGCIIKPYNSSSRGLVKCGTFSIHHTNDPITTALEKGISLKATTLEDQSGTQTQAGLIALLGEQYTTSDLGITPSCGSVDNDTTNPDPDTDPTPTPGDDTPTVKEIPNHVEINLEVEEHQDYIATHLSIHVRAITNVEVFIPVPAEYYCDQDDLAIVEQHFEDYMIHGGPEVLTYNINGNTVTLKIAYETGGIKVTTEGINEDVINYLNEEFKDGVTFEVWNYYKPEALGSSIKDAQKFLRDYLEEHISTVKFTDEPDLYVNAFFFDDNYEDGTWAGYNKDKMNPWDCTVDIVSEQKSDYKDAEDGWFYNTSEYNQLYWNKNYDKDQN